MLPKFSGQTLWVCVLAICLTLTIALPGKAQTGAPALTDDLMNKAIRYFAMVTGRDIGAEDSAWLKDQWQTGYATEPFAVFGRVDQLALQLELQEQSSDPVALASSRNSLIGDAYCATKVSSDPNVARMKTILAPDGLVLASDCVFGLVVTRFDIEGLVASHRMLAEIVGQGYDEAADRATLTKAVTENYADFDATNSQYAAQGELRNAIAAKFWALLAGDPKQAETANKLRSQTGQDPSAIAASARNLETVALQQIGNVDYIAKAGDARLTGGMVAEYLEWLERVAGYSFSSRDRIWLQEALARDFQADPQKLQQEVAGVDKYNRTYILEKDPAGKAAMLEEWAGQLHCYLSASSDQDEKHLDEVLFRHDPVIEADCASNRIARKRDSVVAEAGGQQLTEGMLVPAMRIATLLFGRSLTEGESKFIREGIVSEFKEDPDKFQAELVDYQKIMQNYDGDDFYAELDYQRETNRRNLFVAVYCGMQQSDDPDDAGFVAMLKEANAVVHEDCSNQVVTTERGIEAFIASTNFLAFVNGMPPFTQAEEAEFAEALRQEHVSTAEQALASLTEWWSLLSIEKKIKAVNNIKKFSTDFPSEAGQLINHPVEASQFIQNAVNLAHLDMVMIQAANVACQFHTVVAQGQTGLLVAGIEVGGRVGSINEIGVPTGKVASVIAQAQLADFACGL